VDLKGNRRTTVQIYVALAGLQAEVAHTACGYSVRVVRDWKNRDHKKNIGNS
jgi:hypothetical protein